ncbi:MOSC domain-containing protein [Candidatus Leptofilum sp.]|uniref:MOSC domain-containing protein n=1 Tax=Candidatus Leptofilum sp. TaxID=3241576 RepID=UPI003B59BB11
MIEEFVEVGVVKELYRFPVKSMRGESLQEAHGFWHGLDGDRRYAFVRSDDQSGFPWLTGRQLPQMLQFTPRFAQPEDVVNSPVEVTLPDGRILPIHSPELNQELADAYGKPVNLIKIGRGAFDTQVISVMSTTTVAALSEMIGTAMTPIRFRQNIIIEPFDEQPFVEERWLDSSLVFGNQRGNMPDGLRIRLNQRIQRCVMINIDPETSEKEPAVLKTVAQTRQNCAGVLSSTERPGMVHVGDVVKLVRA